ncbi:hydrolase/acyltransferase [Longirhabdus pacifica]|uniref:hydrolase/acyltransferase n=1 Tax=Longirhabdus pacifica TaxID=2305227 RepID=UPI001008E7BF|nr:hydrolase/acyltransferase [Longirhabdus pacifica]
MKEMKYVILKDDLNIQFVEMPYHYAYQLSALHQRLHKEISKLTVATKPSLAYVVAECEKLERIDPNASMMSGLDYINMIEKRFSEVNETSYPIISLLTEIRALQAQLEQWYEEEYE